MNQQSIVTGGCLCGAVRYCATDRPRISTVCHCDNCRRAGGAQAVAWLVFASACFSFEKGQPQRYRTDTQAERSFCGRCGTPLTYQADDRMHEIDVTTGSTDAPEAFPPTKDIFPAERIPWVPLLHST